MTCKTFFYFRANFSSFENPRKYILSSKEKDKKQKHNPTKFNIQNKITLIYMNIRFKFLRQSEHKRMKKENKPYICLDLNEQTLKMRKK